MLSKQKDLLKNAFFCKDIEAISSYKYLCARLRKHKNILILNHTD